MKPLSEETYQATFCFDCVYYNDSRKCSTSTFFTSHPVPFKDAYFYISPGVYHCNKFLQKPHFVQLTLF